MHFGVIILSWKDEQAAHAQLERLRAWRALKPLLIWVRNEARSAITAPANVEVISLDANHGYAGGINAGLKHIVDRVDAVLILNNDVEITEEAVHGLLDQLASNPDLGAVGPVLIEQNHDSFGGRHPLYHVKTRSDRPSRKGLIPVDYVPGTVCLLRTEAINETGYLHELFFFSGEMADWCLQARRKGYNIAVDITLSARHTTDDPAELRSTLYRYYTLRNRFLFARRYSRVWPLWGCYWTAIGMLMAIKSLFNDRAAGPAIFYALRDGWTGSFGNRNKIFDT